PRSRTASASGRRARAGVPRSTKRPCVPTRRRSADTTKEASMNARSVALLALLVAWPALAAAQTIKVGAVVPLTGRYGGGGAQVRAGYEIGVEHVNAADGGDLPGEDRLGARDGDRLDRRRQGRRLPGRGQR